MLEIFGLQKGGFEYRRLVSAFERIFGATIFFGTDQTRTNSMLIQRSRFNFLREAQSWYDRGPSQPVLSAEFENVIVLSDEFYREITEHPIRQISKPSADGGVKRSEFDQAFDVAAHLARSGGMGWVWFLLGPEKRLPAANGWGMNRSVPLHCMQD